MTDIDSTQRSEERTRRARVEQRTSAQTAAQPPPQAESQTEPDLPPDALPLGDWLAVLDRADGNARERLILGMQQQFGNSYVQGVVAQRTMAEPQDPATASPPANGTVADQAAGPVTLSPAIVAPVPKPAPAPQPAPPQALPDPPAPSPPTPAPPPTAPAPPSLPVPAAPPGPAIASASALAPPVAPATPAATSSASELKSHASVDALVAIQQAAEAEQATISEAAAAARANIAEQTASRTAAILSESNARALSIKGTVELKKAEIIQSLTAARAGAQAYTQSQQAAAAAEGDAAIGRLHDAVQAKRQAAADAAEAQARGIEQTGQTEAGRATESATTSTDSIKQIAETRAAQASGSAEVQQAVREAVKETADAAVTQVDDNARDGAQKATDAANTSGSAIRTAGADLANSLGDHVDEIESAIRQSTANTIEQIGTLGSQYLQALDQLAAQTLTGLDQAAAPAIASVEQAGQASAAEVQVAGDQAMVETDQLETDSLAQLSAGLQQVTNLLVQTDNQNGVTPVDAQRFAGGAAQSFHDAAAEMAAAFGDKSSAVRSAFDAAESAFASGLDQTEQAIGGALTDASASAADNVSAAEQSFANTCDAALGAACDANQQAIDQYANGLQQEIDKSVQKWEADRSAAEGDIKQQIDDVVNGHSQTVAQLPAKLDDVAAEAAAKVDESVLDAIWGAVVSFAEGMLTFLAIVLFVFVIAVAIFELPFALATFLACAAVVGLAFMAYSFLFETLPRRLREMASVFPSDAPWYVQAIAGVAGTITAIAAAAGDVVGVSQLVEGAIRENIVTGRELTPAERAAKITTGVLMLGTLFLFKAVAKGAGVEVPGEEAPGEKGPGGEEVSGAEKTATGEETAEDETSDDNPLITEKGGRRGCFVAGTLVQTPDGLRPIESVRVGELVLALDPESYIEQAQRVVRTYARTADATVTLHTSHGVITCSLEHPFWTIDGGWIEAGQLTRDSPLLASGGQTASITRIERSTATTSVYNLEVDRFATFLVSPAGILVHNKAMQVPQEPVGDLTKPSAKWWKSKGVDPHEIKSDLGGAVSHYDLYVDRAGNIWALRKGAPKSDAIYMGDINDYGPPPSSGGGNEPPNSSGGNEPPNSSGGYEPPDVQSNLGRLAGLENDAHMNAKIPADLRSRLNSPDPATRQAAEAELSDLEQEAAWASNPSNEGADKPGMVPFTHEAAFNEVFDRAPEPLTDPPYNAHPRADYEPVRFEPEGSDRPGEIRRVLVIRGKVGDIRGRTLRFSVAWNEQTGEFADIHQASGK